MSAVAYHEQQTLSGFWSIQAFKYLTGVDGHIAFDVLADLSNNSDAKNKKRLKVLDMYNNSYTDSHIWQLAIDNPDRDIYCFTTDPILYTSFPDYKLAIGPQNFYILNGISYQNVPMTKNTFAAAICYDLHFYLKNDQWVPTLSEVFRLLTFNGQISIFLMDYSVLNCKNEIYSKFFEMLRNALRRDGMDPYPCKSIQKRLREAGFQNIRHAFVSLKKGIPTDLGNIVEFVQSFFECAMFKYVAQLHLSPEELVLFREMKLQYNRDVRNGELLDEFGDFYYMLVFAQKKTY
ncbi:unnamed protein product [Cyberlindnera jadinii]|uniref:Methyltransferase type 11 domain-containing protein n=2 Tax=Cyberlindnera jadinii (strain ATCC 18201 / CBS 1600 / BCRC 20928 / JCM 3617 / NBRC 0987 / NRRL Y-1542) TaxID=983966 RepID=A0A0H5CEJ0_CYBJN|nr:unnamed protein product [Cyberlindnera jadinii]